MQNRASNGAGGAARKVDQYAARKVDHSRAVHSIRSSAFSSVVNPGDRLWESGNLAVCARFPLFHSRVFVASPPSERGVLSLGPSPDRRSYGILGGRVSVRSAFGPRVGSYAFGSGGRRLRMR